MYKILDIEQSCNAIDFNTGSNFTFKITNSTNHIINLSLFDIDGTWIATNKGNTYRLVDETGLYTVTTECEMGYNYLMENCSTNRPVRIDGVRITSSDANNLNQSLRLYRKDMNGITLIKPHGLIEDRNIYQKQVFIDAKFGDLLFLTGDRSLKLSITGSPVRITTMNLLFKFSTPKQENSCQHP